MTADTSDNDSPFPHSPIAPSAAVSSSTTLPHFYQLSNSTLSTSTLRPNNEMQFDRRSGGNSTSDSTRGATPIGPGPWNASDSGDQSLAPYSNSSGTQPPPPPDLVSLSSTTISIASPNASTASASLSIPKTRKKSVQTSQDAASSSLRRGSLNSDMFQIPQSRPRGFPVNLSHLKTSPFPKSRDPPVDPNEQPSEPVALPSSPLKHIKSNSEMGPTSAFESDQYLPGLDYSCRSSVSGTWSEADLKSMPFSARRRLRQAISQAGTLDSPDLSSAVAAASSAMSPHGDFRFGAATPVSVPASIDSSILPRPLSTTFNYSFPDSSPGLKKSRESSFINRRNRRSATMMYPTSADSNQDGVNLSRSVSMSSGPSSAGMASPAYQFLSRFGSISNSPLDVNATNSSQAASRHNGRHNSIGGALLDEPGQIVDNYIIGKMIGYGGFSEVKEALTIDEDGNRKVYAVKIVRKVNTLQSPELMERVQNEFDHEVLLWKSLDHPNILKLLHVFETEKATYCFTSRIEGGTLFDMVKASRAAHHHHGNSENTHYRGIDRELAIKYISELASALLYLHETMHIVHRDVKLENCLIQHEDGDSSKTSLILCDFGMSEYYETTPDLSTSAAATAMKEINAMDTSDGTNDGDISSVEHLRNDEHPIHVNDLQIGPSHTTAFLQGDKSSRRPSTAPLTGCIDDGSGTASTESSVGPSRKNSYVWMSPNNTVSVASASTTNNIGSLPYAAPELLTSSSPLYHPCLDIWSYGVVVYALFMGALPWSHEFAPKLRTMIIEGEWNETGFEAQAGDILTEIVRGCLHKDSATRWTIRKVLEQLKRLNE